MSIENVLEEIGQLRDESDFQDILEKVEERKKELAAKRISTKKRYVYVFPEKHFFSYLNGKEADITKITSTKCIVNINGRVAELSKSRFKELPVEKLGSKAPSIVMDKENIEDKEKTFQLKEQLEKNLLNDLLDDVDVKDTNGGESENPDK